MLLYPGFGTVHSIFSKRQVSSVVWGGRKNSTLGYRIGFSHKGTVLSAAPKRQHDIVVTFQEIRGHEGSVYSLDFSPDGAMLASGGADSCLRVWNTRTSQTPQTRGNTGKVSRISEYYRLHCYNFPSCVQT